MVRILVDNLYGDGKHYIEAAGTSNDTKPSGDYVTMSSFFEVDTRKVYFWDEDSQDWVGEVESNG